MQNANANPRSRFFRYLAYPIVAGLMAGCATPDGGAPTLASTASAVDGGIRSVLENMRKGVDAMREATKVQGPEGKRIKDTPLNNLFAKYPIDGTKPSPASRGELWYPRVALIPVTVPSHHARPFGDTSTVTQKGGFRTIAVGNVNIVPERLCWTYKAKIWDSATKSRDVPEFLYCMDEAMPLVRVGGAQPVSVFGRFFISKTNSGSVFGVGPRQPQQVASRKYIESADVHLRTYGYWNMIGVMTAMGIDPFDLNEGNRVWWADSTFALKDF